MSAKPIPVTGRVDGIAPSDAARLSAVALRGNTVLATSQLKPDGSYRLHLPHDAHAPSAFALEIAVLPSVAAASPASVANAPRAKVAYETLRGDYPVEGPTLRVEASLIEEWYIFWREWCVSGTILGPNGCPAPGASVTVYTVSWTSGGYVKTPRGTVNAGADGTFSLCFPWWNLFFCWPCEPVWWLCWPWWWERDILHVIDTLETRNIRGANATALLKPEPKALIRGQGFCSANYTAHAPDSARTALIARKLANPALRAIFPWRWWCWDEPNVVFGATQAGTVVLDEDPAIDTRWSMPSGENVTLVGNDATRTACPGGPLPSVGMVWEGVGNLLFNFIGPLPPGNFPLDARGFGQVGGDAVDMALAGTLSLYAGAAPDVAFYQVTGTVTPQPAIRGGGAATTVPVTGQLWQTVWIYDTMSDQYLGHAVQMGPFSLGGEANLYCTTNGRPGLPAAAGLGPFPPNPSGFPLLWGNPSLVVYAEASTLLGGHPYGAVSLALTPYDSSVTEIVPAITPLPMPLVIDTTPMTVEQVGTLTAYRFDGTPLVLSNDLDCPSYDVGPNGYVEVPVTVTDTNGFVFQYELQGQYGHGHVAVVSPPGARGYKSNRPEASPDYSHAIWTGETEVIRASAASLGVTSLPDCCYEFRLYYGKRVTNGVDWPVLSEGDFQTISLKFSS